MSSFSYRIPGGSTLFLVTAFGGLSYLEVCTTLASQIEAIEIACDSVIILKLSKSGGFSKDSLLPGIRKFVTPIGELTGPKDFSNFKREISSVFDYHEDNRNFCLSLYCDNDEENYEGLLSGLLDAVRESGIRKANLLRPHTGTEFQTKDVLSRKAIDFVVFPHHGKLQFGVTEYIPEIDELRDRAINRPVVSSEISLSPRLARVLVNLSGLTSGKILLDPFCGSGTILGEAMLNGIDCVGIDRDSRRITNAERNLRWMTANSGNKKRRMGSFSLIKGEVRNLPKILKTQVDGVVTEPILLPKFTFTPNVDKAKRLMRRTSALYTEFLYAVADVVKRGGRIVIVAPSIHTYEGKDVSMTFEELGEAKLGLFQPRSDLLFGYPVRVGLEGTRWIRRLVYVFERL